MGKLLKDRQRFSGREASQSPDQRGEQAWGGGGVVTFSAGLHWPGEWGMKTGFATNPDLGKAGFED